MSFHPAARLAAAPSTRSGVRAFSCTAAARAKPRRVNDANDPMSIRKMEEFRHDDIPTLGHLALQRKRELLHYARLADSGMPKLKSFAKPYQPPAPDAILRVRSHHYQGEAHPSTRKAVVTVTLPDLQRTGALQSDAAVHKFTLLAGTRFNHERQEVKVACERFPEEAQNVRWAAERIELLVKEANEKEETLSLAYIGVFGALVQLSYVSGYLPTLVLPLWSLYFPSLPNTLHAKSSRVEKRCKKESQTLSGSSRGDLKTSPEEFADVPLDRRHELARESKRLGMARRSAATLKDFPKEWL